MGHNVVNVQGVAQPEGIGEEPRGLFGDTLHITSLFLLLVFVSPTVSCGSRSSAVNKPSVPKRIPTLKSSYK